MFGRRTTFGKQKPSVSDLMKMQPTPDSDGVTRVLPKTLWDDPKIGSMLRDCGFEPDDPRNIRPTAEDYADLIEASHKRLEERVETFNREMAARHGYCRAAPFMVIDGPVWAGEHGAFLNAGMGLLPFDDWNVLMLAGDVRTKDVCGLAGHPGPIPAVTEAVIQYVVEWRQRHEVALEAYGITATGAEGRGITREEYEAKKDALRQDIVDQIAWMKQRIISELERIQA